MARLRKRFGVATGTSTGAGARAGAAPGGLPEGLAHLEGAWLDLTAVLDPDDVLADPLATRLYARDASILQGSAALVVLPRDRDQVVECLRVAREHDLAVVPRGGGTGLAGGAIPTGDMLVVGTSKMTRMLEIRPEDRLAWVEPGIANLDLSGALEPYGFTFAPDPSSQPTSSVGGNVATNAGGPHCLAHGVTSNHVLAVELALPTGGTVRLGSEGPEAPGYDLRGLVVGSEGMLGVVTAVCVRLTPLPPAVRTMLYGFGSIEQAAAAVSGVIAAGVVPGAMEMLDQPMVRIMEPYAHAGYPTDAAAVLLIEVEGMEGGVAEQVALIDRITAEHGRTSAQVAADEAQRARIWKGRKSAAGAVAKLAPHYYLHDTVVPRSKLAEVLVGVDEIARRHGVWVAHVFHAGDGNLHPMIPFDLADPGALEVVVRASKEIVRLCVDAGGTLSGEHGIGLEKRDLMPLLFSDDDLDAQACVRAAFDPDGRMNPRKVLPTGAKCGDYAMAQTGGSTEALAKLPEGTWI